MPFGVRTSRLIITLLWKTKHYYCLNVSDLFLGIYGKVIWLIVSAVIIGIGHIGIHLQHLKSITIGVDTKKHPDST